MQQIMIVILGLTLAIPTYGISIIVAVYVFNKNGKRLRNYIFHNLINDAYKYSKGESLTTDLVFFESAIKFAEENGGKLSQFKDSIAFNTVALGDDIVVVFSKDFNNNLQYVVDNSKKLEMEIIKENNDKDIENSDLEFNQKDIDNKYIADRQHIINQLNKAELDYEDMIKAYQEINGDSYLLNIEMKNEENFFLPFETAKDLKIATELVYFKLGIAVSELGKEMNKYYEEIGLGKLLLNFKKMIFSEFINQYQLSYEQRDSVYKWEEKNNEKDRREKIVDFRGYSLDFMNYGQGLQAIIIANSQNDVEHKTPQEELDEIPF